MGNSYLVILKKPYLDAILDGRKRVESRFSKSRFYTSVGVMPGDKLFLKISSGPVCGIATVETVKNFENLTPAQMIEIKQQYNHLIGGGDEYWQKKADCKFGFLVWLKDVRVIDPVRIHKTDWRAWVVLTEKENFGLLNIGDTIKHSK
ncbi:MAG: ASCH domain-containing protein [Planctomycetota bacterium]|jgi:ASC-1-like (ASCH) protein